MVLEHLSYNILNLLNWMYVEDPFLQIWSDILYKLTQ